MADPYKTLGVARSATEDEIKRAYRQLAKELHPDRNKDNPKAAERFSQVTQAYDLLTDKDKRARFDRGEIDGDGNPSAPFGYGQRGAAAGGGSRGFEFGGDGAEMGDIFENLFGGSRATGGFGGFGRNRPPQRGANITYRLAVRFEDAATLAPQRVTLADGKSIELKLPPGVEDGLQMRLAGHGHPGPSGPGDAMVTIEIRPHRFFKRVGDDVRLDLPVSLSEAVLGANIRVPTVDGPVMLTIPKGSTSGKTLRLKGKGFTRKDGSRGDQFVTLLVDLPVDDDALIEFVQGWPGRDGSNPRGDLGV